MAYSVSTINQQVHTDPQGFMAAADADYQAHIRQAAEAIAANRSQSHIVLLSGPSGSGKTTTAKKIEAELKAMGIETHTISMDNYFNTVDPETSPRTPQGAIDYESPFAMDIDLLNRHFAMLDKGEVIHVPKFEFARQMRSAIRSKPLQLGEDEVVIFEGIHALNDVFTGRNPKAFKLYIAARSNILDDAGNVLFEHRWVRLCRRIVRDNKFRGSDAAFTLKLWDNVCRGEKLYISPFKENANILFDTMHPYEVCVLKDQVVPLLEELPVEKRSETVNALLKAFVSIESMAEAAVPQKSLLREFIGGGIYDVY
ncbi:adenylyl-sulfate kinase [Bengtsoniella intestinalis]|uniref:uridine kinase family protein n=1 Tax=Bengtsoniella intestinalis TaxID=3073143 RepID=UPI00391F0325